MLTLGVIVYASDLALDFEVLGIACYCFSSGIAQGAGRESFFSE